MLALCTLTPLFVVTLPNMSLPPMFTTIGEELGLSLVEIGLIWGMVSFTGIFFALIGGALGDWYGARMTLFVMCVLTGLSGLMRSFSQDFISFLLTSLIFGIFQAAIPVILFKVAREWFPLHQLGMASGVISAGFASGLMLGPLLSTSLILPAFGGWRQVLVSYGVVAVVFGLLWLFFHPAQNMRDTQKAPRVPLMASLRHVVRLREVWVLGLGGLGIMGCFQGFTGYLPTYLKAIGWAELDADRALAAFFITSLCAVVPFSILSDRLRWRRGFLIFAAGVLGTGIALLGFVEGSLIILVLAGTGLLFDSFMAILNASVLEADGVSNLYAGTALGFSLMIRNLGGTFSPPVGNGLTSLGLGTPFIFWGGLGLFAVFMFILLRKSPKKKNQ